MSQIQAEESCLHRCIYASVLNANKILDGRAKLRQILYESEQRNLEHSISGMLLYDEQTHR